MRIFWAIIVALIIVFISGLLFNILKIAMGSGSSFIGVIIQLTPFMIGIWLIKYSWTKITYTEEPKENIIDNTQSLAKAVINHSKELVQEVKPTINNYIQKHNKIDEIVIKDNLKVEDINEDEIYEQVLHEIEKDDKVKSTWAKALSQSDGDDKKAQSLYIKLRVDFLIEEKKKIIENQKREYEELEKKRVEHERLEQEKVENERRFKEKVENEKRERERLERHKLEDKKMAKIMAKAFIGIIIAFIIYFSYDQLTDIFSIEKQVGNGDKYYLKTFKQDYKEALKWYEKAATKGNIKAQYNLGEMYRLGQGVNQDFKESFKWYEKAAIQDNIWAQFYLGGMYYLGLEVNQDYKEAFKWFEKAANKGNSKAQYSLGKMYRLGEGTQEDDKEALKWYEKAANQGLDEAQYSLANMYYFGNGVDKDYKEAFKWYEKAAIQGHYWAQNALGEMYDYGKGVKENDYEAFKWYEKAANQGSSMAQKKFIDIYLFGIVKDYNKAFKWQEKAAIQGNRFLGFDINCFNRDLETLNLNEKMTTDEDSYSQCMLGVKLYLDYDKRKEAVKWFEESAIQGNIFAQSILGKLYYAGYEVNKNYHEAVKWYEKAAIQGYYVAQYELGNMYYFGRGVNQDYNEAIKWYEKSALQGNVNAQNDLGYMYKAGKGVNQDYKEAFKWYEKAAIQGNSKAKLEIGEMYQFGQGLNKDYKEAFKLYKEASTQGNEGKYKLRELDYYGWSIN